MRRGAVYVAFGPKALAAMRRSVASLWQHNDIDVAVVKERGIDLEVEGAVRIAFDEPGPGARWAKLNVDLLVEWDQVLYLDADTLVHGSIVAPFGMLDDGFDLVMAPSTQQGINALWHVGGVEKGETFDGWGGIPLQLQGGVMWFHRGRCGALFETWREEWLKYKGQDQAALLRALDREPVRLHVVGRSWNGGAVIEHLFGTAR